MVDPHINHYNIFLVTREYRDSPLSPITSFSAFSTRPDLFIRKERAIYELPSIQTLAGVIVDQHFDFLMKEDSRVPLNLELSFSFDSPAEFYVSGKSISKHSGSLTRDAQREFIEYVQDAIKLRTHTELEKAEQKRLDEDTRLKLRRA